MVDVQARGTCWTVDCHFRQFKNHGKDVDWEAYEKLVLRQIAAGVAGIVAVGTTGESPTLSTEEAQKAISEAVRLGRGTVQVIAGTGACIAAD